MTAGIRRPLSLLVVEPSPWRELFDLTDNPRVVITVTPLARLLSAAAELRPDLVLLPGLPHARREQRRLRLRGTRSVRPGDLPEAAGDPVAALAVLAARPGAGLSSGPPVSVVATVLDERHGVDDLVAKVAEQLGADDELVVVDGGSSDGTFERLQELASTRSWLRAVSAPGTNISAGRNVGIANARNSVIATTDAGCVPGSDWLESLRLPFAEADPPGLVAGVPKVAARNALERAQAHACYPDPDELVHPGAFVRAYTSVLGLGFDPRVPFARSISFTKEAWELAGGFPERLGWVEDGVFGRSVAEHLPCVATQHALVTWHQRGSLSQTFAMYRNYGIGAAQSGDATLAGRDVARVVAYLAAAGVLVIGRSRATIPLLAAGLGYMSLPAARAFRHRAGPATIALIPLAMATKDWGKVSGLIAARRDRWQP